MIKRKIFQELREKTGLSDRRIYELIDELRVKLKTYSRETAAYVFASEKNVKLHDYLNPEELVEVRDAIRTLNILSIPSTSPPVKKIRKSVSQQKKTRIIQLPDLDEFDVPNLPSSAINEAVEMSRVYPIIYLFENSMRAFIKEVLDEHNPDWWNDVKKTIKNEVESRMKREVKNRYHGRRGIHPIQYVDFDHLRNLVSANQVIFKEYLPDNSIEWLTQRLREVKESRNILAHNNPLTKEDIQRVNLYFGDWIRQISNE